MDKTIKLLLLIVNKNNINVNLETKTKYNKNQDKLYTEYTLVFWHLKYTKDNKECWYSTTQQFNNKTSVLKYLAKVKEGIDERKA